MIPPQCRLWLKIFFLIAVCFAIPACKSRPPSPEQVTLNLLSSADKRSWIEPAVERFNKASLKISKNRPAKVTLKFAPNEEFGRLANDPALRTHAATPSAGWILTAANLSPAAETKRLFAAPGKVLIRTPLVFMAYRSIAEQMGWLDSGLGWRDLSALSAEPQMSTQTSKGNHFSLSLPNPASAHAGAMALLAFAAVARPGIEIATTTNLETPAVSSIFSSIQSSLPCYFPSSDALAATMAETAPHRLSIGIVFEHQVVKNHTSKNYGPLVALSPREGTWIADHPFALVDRDWVGPDEKEAADLLLAHLLSPQEQAKAEELGMRPAARSPRRAAPFLPPDGLDPAEPIPLNFLPNANLVETARQLWERVRQPFEIFFLLDSSSSMAARKPSRIELSKQLILLIASHSRPEDRLALIIADEPPRWVIPLKPSKEAFPLLKSALEDTRPNCPDAFHDSILSILRGLEKQKPLQNPVLLFLFSDGTDDGSRHSFRETLDKLNDFSSDGTRFRIFSFSLNGPHGFDAMRRLALITGGRVIEPSPENLESAAKEAATSF